MAKKDEEIDLAIKAVVKLYEVKKKLETDDKYQIGSNLTRMLYYARKIDKAIDLFKNIVFFTTTCHLLLK